jgi:hypothetical protein
MSYGSARACAVYMHCTRARGWRELRGWRRWRGGRLAQPSV